MYEKQLYFRENVQIRLSPNKLRYWAGFHVFYEKWHIPNKNSTRIQYASLLKKVISPISLRLKIKFLHQKTIPVNLIMTKRKTVHSNLFNTFEKCFKKASIRSPINPAFCLQNIGFCVPPPKAKIGGHQFF